MFEKLLKFTGLQASDSSADDVVGRWPTHPLSVSVDVQPPRSFHPVLHYDLTELQRGVPADYQDAAVVPPIDPLKRPDTACHQLLMYQPLPADLYVDPFQLEQLWPQSHGLYWRHHGVVELERPVDEVPSEGTGLVLVLWSMPPANAAASASASASEPVAAATAAAGWRWPQTVSVPIHGRYQMPLARSMLELGRAVTVPPATFYWRCMPPLRPAEEQWAQLERVNAQKSRVAQVYPEDHLYQVPKLSVRSAVVGDDAAAAAGTVVVTLPAGELSHASLVALGTLVCVMIGIIWLIWAVLEAKKRIANPRRTPTTPATTTPAQAAQAAAADAAERKRD